MEDPARRSRQTLEGAPPHPVEEEEEEYDDQEEEDEEQEADRGRARHHHRRSHGTQEEDEEEEEEGDCPPVYDDDIEEEEEEEEEEGNGGKGGYPVPHPRPHHQGLTPLLGRRLEEQGGNHNTGGAMEEEEDDDPEEYAASPERAQEDGEEQEEEEEGDPEEHPASSHSLAATLEMEDAESGTPASSDRKQSVADSLATTATVYRTGSDRAPARATTMRSLSVLYALLLTALGVVFPLAFFLSGRSKETGMCFALLHIYVTLTSIIFIIYLNIAIWRHKRRERLLAGDAINEPDDGHQGANEDPEEDAGKEHPVAPEENGFLTRGGPDSPPSPAPRKHPQPPATTTPSPGGTLAPTTPPSPRDPRMRTLEAGFGVRVVLVGQTEDGVNWFLRLGLIAFGMGSMVLDGFRLVQFAEADVSVQCIGLLFIIFTSLRLLFTFAQTFFLFKNHRVMINFSPLLCRFAMLHLAATNLVTWVMTVIMEGTNSFVHHQYDVTMNDVMGPDVNVTVINDTVTTEALTSNVTEGAVTTDSRTLQWLFEDMPPLDCYQKRSLATEASPFLFPCVVEYSLLAVAVLCRMYVNVGRPLPNDVTDVKENPEGKIRGTLECHKANSGLFIGLFVFTLVCIGMLFFLLFQTGVNPISEPLTGLVYYGSDVTVNILCLIALTPAFAQMRKLHFSVFVKEVFNENLMYISLLGFFTLIGLMTVPSLMSICAGGMLALLSELQAISCILSLIQACVQVVFIFDGLRRRAATRTHFRSKPGRSLITFLLLCNVSLWVIDTFELKEAITAELFTDFYGRLPWILIVHTVLPLTIFFRFHSTVCLSDMWVNAYQRPRLATTRPLSSDRYAGY